MSTDVDSPSWEGSSPPTISNDPRELETVIERLSLNKTSDFDVYHSENDTDSCTNPSTICIRSESSEETKSDASKYNNNMSECEFELKNKESNVHYVCLEEETNNNENITVKDAKRLKHRRHSKKRKSVTDRIERKSKEMEMCQPLNRINGKNKSCGIPSEHNLATVGGDGEENRQERSQCRQHELNSSSSEINRLDVITSCDLTSNSVGNFHFEEETDGNKLEKKDCPRSRLSSCSTTHSTCSEGSYSRRKHHKHHKQKQKHKSPVRPEEGSSISPKVNPIFLWVRQEDTRIVEVLCEDYDHRNRLRLTRTHLGWRAIPKTKCFSEVIIPKPKPKEGKSKTTVKPKQTKINKKKKKTTKKSKAIKNYTPDNPNQIKQCSVALSRDDLANYSKTLMLSNSPEEQLCSEDAEKSSKSESTFSQPSNSEYKSSSMQSRSPSPHQELISTREEIYKKSKKLIKSKSCNFPSLQKVLQSLPRSISLDFKLNVDNNDSQVQNTVRDVLESNNCVPTTDKFVLSVKNEPEVDKCEGEKQEKTILEETLGDNTLEETDNQTYHSESLVMDMTKHDSDFNDADCDELGQLLKDIPDLEFVEEEELEEVDEDEEWSMPTDLTIPKPLTENRSSDVKLPVLPPNISPLVTVTSSTKPPEPLTAPLPEVTITPIPNPKPAHQNKSQNNFLENLLSSLRSVKSENEKTGFAHKTERKSVESFVGERKASKHSHENDFESEIKNKKLKLEDITLKSLLSKHQNGKTIKSLDLETCIQNLKATDGEECPKSRLQELLTSSVNSDPISQLKEVLSNPHLAVPDPLLVPRARLPALVASPASEIPRLLSMHLQKAIKETPCPPVTDPDVLEVSLSNLQSLLSCSPEKLKSANTQDLANYQKSLETFLEWQRYQTELMEAQLNNSKSLPPGFPGDIADMATATALSRMLWLPYLNQMDFNCNNNRDFLAFMNSMLTHDYQGNCSNFAAPPQINISQVPQPSPFLTPTSPMDIESHLKTLAMWQEAVMMQQNSQSSKVCAKASSTPTQQDVRKAAKISNMSHSSSLKKQSHLTSQQTMRGLSHRGESLPNGHLGFEIYQDMGQNEYQKKHSRQNSLQQRLEEHQKQLELQQKYKQDQQNQFRKMQRNYSNHQAELMRQTKVNDRKKPRPMPGSISVKPLSNLIDKNNLLISNKNYWEQFEEDIKKTSEYTNQAKLQHFNAYNQKNKIKEEKIVDWQSRGFKVKQCSEKPNLAEVKGNAAGAPKLKVKNLVDPNMSPPKLLKQIAPEHLPMVMEEQGPVQDDPQGQLWHPLFGSNQGKGHPYNSPWRWTTVTVNGE